MKKQKISALKDKDLMEDTGGITKTRDYGEHKRPPRTQQRDNFRERYLDKEQKKDLLADLDIDNNGQVYVDNKDIVKKMSDIVSVPEYVNPSYQVSLEKSLNDDFNYENIQLNKDSDQQDNEFLFYDDNVDDVIYNDDKEDEEVIISQDEEEQTNPFDGIFDDVEDDETEQTEEQETTDEENTEQESQETNEDEQTEESNDAIDEYLNMEIDDSKLSEENKEKLDNFTQQQMDAFKKFLYENKVKKEEQ